MRSRPTSFRLTDDDLAKLASLAHPGESQIAVIRRALVALAGSQRPKDAPAGSPPYAGLALQVNALQARLEALEAMMARLAPPALPGALPDALPDALPPPASVARDALPVATPSALPVAKSALPAPGGYPTEIKTMAIKLKAEGKQNREIAEAIKARLGRCPDSKNMTAILRQWQKALSGL